MMRYRRRTRVLAASLSALAGFVDAAGYLQVGGFFVSFMSGNSTRMGVALAQGQGAAAATAAGLIVAFVLGVTLGSLVAQAVQLRRRSAVLVAVAALLGLAALLALGGHALLGALCAAAAMGAENSVFEHDGDLQLGLTYMTGTLAKIGQRLAVALRGGGRLLWLPFAVQWLALAGGSIVGAALYPRLGAHLLWIAGAVALLIAALLAHFGTDVRQRRVRD